jgi:hypothetical protein
MHPLFDERATERDVYLIRCPCSYAFGWPWKKRIQIASPRTRLPDAVETRRVQYAMEPERNILAPGSVHLYVG